MNLGLELHEGALVGATPMNHLAKNDTLEPVTLSFDSKETKEKVLKAAEKKNRKGVGTFPTLGKLKYYFSDVRTRQRSAVNRSEASPPVDSVPEVAKLRQQALLNKRMTNASSQ